MCFDPLVAAVDGLDRDRAMALLNSVTFNDRGGARRLKAHLRAHPDAFTSGSSLGPPTKFRLMETMEAGGLSVAIQGCADCRRRTRLRNGSTAGGSLPDRDAE